MADTTQFPLLEASWHPVGMAPYAPCEIYLVVGYNRRYKYWKVFRETSAEEFAVLEKAVEHAQKIQEKGDWEHLRIAKLPIVVAPI